MENEHYYNGYYGLGNDTFPKGIRWYDPNTSIHLTKEEVKILSNYLLNEYLPNHDPERALLLKIHQFAESK